MDQELESLRSAVLATLKTKPETNEHKNGDHNEEKDGDEDEEEEEDLDALRRAALKSTKPEPNLNQFTRTGNLISIQIEEPKPKLPDGISSGTDSSRGLRGTKFSRFESGSDTDEDITSEEEQDAGFQDAKEKKAKGKDDSGSDDNNSESSEESADQSDSDTGSASHNSSEDSSSGSEHSSSSSASSSSSSSSSSTSSSSESECSNDEKTKSKEKPAGLKQRLSSLITNENKDTKKNVESNRRVIDVRQVNESRRKQSPSRHKEKSRPRRDEAGSSRENDRLRESHRYHGSRDREQRRGKRYSSQDISRERTQNRRHRRSPVHDRIPRDKTNCTDRPSDKALEARKRKFASHDGVKLGSVRDTKISLRTISGDKSDSRNTSHRSSTEGRDKRTSRMNSNSGRDKQCPSRNSKSHGNREAHDAEVKQKVPELAESESDISTGSGTPFSSGSESEEESSRFKHTSEADGKGATESTTKSRLITSMKLPKVNVEQLLRGQSNNRFSDRRKRDGHDMRRSVFERRDNSRKEHRSLSHDDGLRHRRSNHDRGFERRGEYRKDIHGHRSQSQDKVCDHHKELNHEREQCIERHKDKRKEFVEASSESESEDAKGGLRSIINSGKNKTSKVSLKTKDKSSLSESSKHSHKNKGDENEQRDSKKSSQERVRNRRSELKMDSQDIAGDYSRDPEIHVTFDKVEKAKISVLDRLGAMPAINPPNSGRGSVKDRLDSGRGSVKDRLDSGRGSVKDRIDSGRGSVKDRLGKKLSSNHQVPLEEDDLDLSDNDFDNQRNVEIRPRASVIELKNRVKLKRPVPLMSIPLEVETDPTRKIVKRSNHSEETSDSLAPFASKSKSTTSLKSKSKSVTPLRLKSKSTASLQEKFKSSSRRTRDEEGRGLKSSRKSGEEELEERIKKIKAKNAAIQQKQKEIDEEKKRYGCS